jgi:protein-tyrosine phosphatase
MDNKRHFQLDGASNFRDIGGLITQKGYLMKSGILFRSDELSRLSNNDLEILKRLDIKLIFDLRTPNERKSNLDRIPQNKGIKLVNVPFYNQYNNSTYLQLFELFISKRTRLDYKHYFKTFYNKIVFEQTHQVNQIITMISDPRNLPAIIHCSAGKDRTGIISALIQLVAGVPRNTALEDYLITNRYYQPRMNKYRRYFQWMDRFQVSPGHIFQIFEARLEYLDEVLDEIFDAFGSIEGYLNNACGIDADTIFNLQKLLLN